MRYLALCCDYDGTLATHGRLLPETVEALDQLIASGRRLIMVTGRQLDDLQSVCDRLDLFEYVVAENGALLYHPTTRAEKALGPRPPDEFVARLRAQGVEGVSQGRVIVATWEPYETLVLETIRELGLPIADRPGFFASLAPRLQELRARTGRPHWIVVDEAHHLLPAQWQPGPLALPEKLSGVWQVTVHPDLIVPKALADETTLIAVGKQPIASFQEYGRVCKVPVPHFSAGTREQQLDPGDALMWDISARVPPRQLKIAPGHTERRRHTRKYAEGELPPERSFSRAPARASRQNGEPEFAPIISRRTSGIGGPPYERNLS